MGEGETVNPIFTEFTTAKAIWLGVIVLFTAFALFRAMRRRRSQSKQSRRGDGDAGW